MRFKESSGKSQEQEATFQEDVTVSEDPQAITFSDQDHSEFEERQITFACLNRNNSLPSLIGISEK